MNPGGFYTEEIVDATNSNVIGILFQTNGLEINLDEYRTALKLQAKYNVPIKVVNRAIYRKKAGLESYDKFEMVKFSKNIDEFIEQYSNPGYPYEPLKKIMDRFFNDVVVQGQYDEEIKEIIRKTFSKVLEEKKTKMTLKPETVLENALNAGTTQQEVDQFVKTQIHEQEMEQGEIKE